MLIGSRSSARMLALVLAVLVCACSSTPPAPPVIAGTWATEMRYPADAQRSGSLFVEWKDPAGAADLESFAAVVYDIAQKRGYTRADHVSKADYVCCLGVRYFGRTSSSGGTAEVLSKAGAEISGGHPEWIDCDRSGPDLHVAQVTTVPITVRGTNFFRKLFAGAPPAEWAMVLDVAVGARDAQMREAIQRYEGRMWASAKAGKLERGEAIEAVRGRVASLLERALP